MDYTVLRVLGVLYTMQLELYVSERCACTCDAVENDNRKIVGVKW